MASTDTYDSGDTSGSAGAPPASAAAASGDVKPAVADATLTIRVKDQVHSVLTCWPIAFSTVCFVDLH